MEAKQVLVAVQGVMSAVSILNQEGDMESWLYQQFQSLYKNFKQSIFYYRSIKKMQGGKKAIT